MLINTHLQDAHTFLIYPPHDDGHNITSIGHCACNLTVSYYILCLTHINHYQTLYNTIS